MSADWIFRLVYGNIFNVKYCSHTDGEKYSEGKKWQEQI